MFLCKSESMLTCNFSCRIETEGFLEVTGNIRSGIVSKIVQYSDIVTTDYS